MFERHVNGHNILSHLILATIVGMIAYLILAVSFNLNFDIAYDSSIFFITIGMITAIISFALLEKC